MRSMIFYLQIFRFILNELQKLTNTFAAANMSYNYSKNWKYVFFINNFLEQRNGGRNQDSNSIFNVIPCFDPSVTSDHAANHLLYHKLHPQVDVYIQYPGWPRDPFLRKLTRYKTKNNIFDINNNTCTLPDQIKQKTLE